jgi:hypothetical protein
MNNSNVIIKIKICDKILKYYNNKNIKNEKKRFKFSKI